MAENTKKENIEMIFIDELLSDIIEEYNLTPYDKKIEFVLDSPDDVKLYGDYNKINILFFNIYKNAIEAIKNKGIIKTTVTPDIGKTIHNNRRQWRWHISRCSKQFRYTFCHY